MDTSDVKDILVELLDEKLELHLNPIKEDFIKLKEYVHTEKQETGQTISRLKTEYDEAKAENKQLQQQVLKLEEFQRKNNLKLMALQKTKMKT